MLWTSALPGPAGRAARAVPAGTRPVRVTAAGGVCVTTVSDAGVAPGPAVAGADGTASGRASRSERFPAIPPLGAGLGARPPPPCRGSPGWREGGSPSSGHTPTTSCSAGGTIARHVRADDEVHAIVVADGAGSRYPHELIGVLEKQARLAAEVIGCSSLRFLGLPDQRLDAIPLIELTQRPGGGTRRHRSPRRLHALPGRRQHGPWPGSEGRLDRLPPVPPAAAASVRGLRDAVLHGVGLAAARRPAGAEPVRRRDRDPGYQGRRDGMLRDRAARLPASAVQPGAPGTGRVLGQPYRPARSRAVPGPRDIE